MGFDIGQWYLQDAMNRMGNATDRIAGAVSGVNRAKVELDAAREDRRKDILIGEKLRKMFKFRVENAAERDAAELTLQRLFDEKLAEAGLDAKTIAALKADAEKHMAEQFRIQHAIHVKSNPKWKSDFGFNDEEIADFEARIGRLTGKEKTTGKLV